jgi:two-component system, OmpR family, sensor histidine kinase KdpD
LQVVQEPCEVQDLAGAALAQLPGPAAAALSSHPLVIDLPAGLPLVQVDFALITRVLVNLIDNALKYSPADGPVELRACVADGQMEIEVADRGLGVPPEDLERIFDKFYRVQPTGTKRAGAAEGRSGTGLGLAIVRGIAEAHGGRIQAENRPGGGTLFHLMLPLAPAAALTEGQT